jgi:protein-S-isoprenylcysteine O-methyltransferase Ste14
VGNIDKKLFIQALSKYLMGLVLFGLLLFLPAGTFEYWNAWVLIVALFGPMLVLGAVLLFKSPELLAKRLASKEKESQQKTVVALSALMFLASFILAGLDFRYGWTSLPSWTVWTATGVLLLSYLMYAEVMRENAYLSRTIEVQDNQKVIDTGLYGIVRHPMYSATVFLFLSMPLILGSMMSFVVMLVYIPIINARIKNEEKVLSEGLPGYKEYKQKVRSKVIPFIW